MSTSSAHKHTLSSCILLGLASVGAHDLALGRLALEHGLDMLELVISATNTGHDVIQPCQRTVRAYICVSLAAYMDMFMHVHESCIHT